MNYKESKLILEKVKKAKRILINCHRGPDPDSVGGALALYYVLMGMGKTVQIICPTDILYNLEYLKDFKKIKTGIAFDKFDFSRFDLFITIDSSSWYMVTGDKGVEMPNIPIVVIDHHETNTEFGEINLVDKKVISAAEILYFIFEDWGIKINKNIATALLTGIIADSGVFKFPKTTVKTFDIAEKLIRRGASKDEIIFNIYRRLDYSEVKFWGEVLQRVKHDKEGKFVWAAVPYEVYAKYLKPATARENVVNLFASIIEGVSFGFVMIEQEKDKLNVSFRTRGPDISKLATSLGGGGHKEAAGAKIEGLPFDKAVKKVLGVARKYAKKYSKANSQ